MAADFASQQEAVEEEEGEEGRVIVPMAAVA